MSKSRAQLEGALAEIHSDDRGKTSVRSIAKKYGIPSSTLHDHVSKKAKTIGAGKPTVLAPDEEVEISYSC